MISWKSFDRWARDNGIPLHIREAATRRSAAWEAATPFGRAAITARTVSRRGCYRI